jgi:hypothetical protein
MKRSVATWVVTSPPELSGEASMSELGHSFFLLVITNYSDEISKASAGFQFLSVLSALVH